MSATLHPAQPLESRFARVRGEGWPPSQAAVRAGLDGLAAGERIRWEVADAFVKVGALYPHGVHRVGTLFGSGGRPAQIFGRREVIVQSVVGDGQSAAGEKGGGRCSDCSDDLHDEPVEVFVLSDVPVSSPTIITAPWRLTPDGA